MDFASRWGWRYPFAILRKRIRRANRVTKHLLDENDVLRLLNEVVDRGGRSICLGEAVGGRPSSPQPGA